MQLQGVIGSGVASSVGIDSTSAMASATSSAASSSSSSALVAANFEQASSLIDKQLPEQAKSLADNACNLEKVAQYCEDIYVNSKESDKQHLLNETKSYTSQALASVAYQIHVLAQSFLALLEHQSAILADLNVSMAHVAHDVNIHKEKVARREIGILTTNKSVMRTAKVKKPEMEEKPVKYVRRPIDYSVLDDVGHGVKLPTRHSDPLAKFGVQPNSSAAAATMSTICRQNSYSSTHSSSAVLNATTASNSQLDMVIGSGLPGQSTPPMMLKSSQLNTSAVGTVRSIQHQQSSGSGSHYRAPVVPPSVPSEYLSRQELGIYSSKKELNQSLASASGGGGGDTSLLHGAYGGGMSYRRPSQSSTNNMSLNLGPSGDYSDTIDRRMAASYMQQFHGAMNSSTLGYNSHLNAALMGTGNNGNNSVGYASGKEIGIIRTNLNNIDYATNGTIYRRPQLHPSIYEQQQQQQQRPSGGASAYPMRTTGSGSGLPPPPPPPLPSSLLLQHQQPPPPPPIPPQPQNYLANTNEIDDDVLHVVSGHDDVDEDDDDHDVIPNWVPINRCLEKVLTTFDYEGQRDDELSFKENTFIYVIKKNDDHWYEGIMKNEMGQIVQGLYPYNYARCVKRYVDDARVSQC